MPLTEFRNKINKLSQFNLEQEINNIINSNSKFLSDLLRRQLATGIDANQEPVLLRRRGGEFPYYSDRTVFEKEIHGVALGKETDRITFYMTGAFYTSIYVFSSGREFIFDSDISYYSEIIRMNASGFKIMELNQENIEIFKREILVPQLQEAWLSKSTQ